MRISTLLRPAAALCVAATLALPAAAQNTHIVRVGPNQTNTFEPADLIVGVGDTVEWVWESGFHNVNATSGAFLSGTPGPAPQTFSVTFDAAFLAGNPVAGDVYDYVCDLHAVLGMTGSVSVLPARTLSASATAGASASIVVTGGNPGGTVILGYSLAGNGPTATQYGTLALSAPFTQLPPRTLDPGGDVNVLLPVPAGAAGLTAHVHGLELLGGGTGIFLPPVTIVVQ
jgi:plastocyanin